MMNIRYKEREEMLSTGRTEADKKTEQEHLEQTGEYKVTEEKLIMPEMKQSVTEGYDQEEE